MKTVKFWLVALFMASPIFIFSNFRPETDRVFNTNVYAESALSRIRLEVDKPRASSVFVRITDEEGWIIHDQRLGAGKSTGQVNFNTCGLPDGKYRLEVGNERVTDARIIEVLTPEVAGAKRRINIWPTE